MPIDPYANTAHRKDCGCPPCRTAREHAAVLGAAPTITAEHLVLAFARIGVQVSLPADLAGALDFEAAS